MHIIAIDIPVGYEMQSPPREDSDVEYEITMRHLFPPFRTPRGVVRAEVEQQEIKRPEDVDAEQGKRGNPEDSSLPESDQSEETARDE